MGEIGGKVRPLGIGVLFLRASSKEEVCVEFMKLWLPDPASTGSGLELKL